MTSDDKVRYTLRMDAELFNRIRQLAEEDRRSIAKEIEEAISYYVGARDESHLS